MNRWISKAVTCASLVSTLALLPSGIALANEGGSIAPKHGHHHHSSFLGAAARLDSLTSEQRTSIQQLEQAEHDARIPVRQAEARFLTLLATQVDQASIEPNTLAPALTAERTASTAEAAGEKDTLGRLHALLTPAQRSQLVDRIENWHSHARGESAKSEHEKHGEHGAKLGLTPRQKKDIRANLQAAQQAKASFGPTRSARRAALESFRGDSFDPSVLVNVAPPGERAEKLAQAMVPVLSPTQRATLAANLRARAAHEGRGL